MRLQGKGVPPAQKRGVPLKRKLSDLFLYSLIGMACVGVTIAWGIGGPEVSYSWYSFSFFTVILAAVLLKMYWPVRKSTKVWVLLALLFAGHVGLYVLILHRVQQLSAFWYFLTMPFEVMLIAAVIYKCIHVLPPKVNL
jgi:hypothetical protein